jgi:hypothetical protein
MKLVTTQHSQDEGEEMRYDITLRGLVALLQAHNNARVQEDYLRDEKKSDRDNPKLIEISDVDMHNIAICHEELLPRILSKWTYFRNKGVQDLACAFLTGAAKDTFKFIEALDYGRDLMKIGLTKLAGAFDLEGDEKVIRHDIYAAMLLLGWSYPTEPHESWTERYGKWRKAVCDDSDLSKLAIEEADRLTAEIEEDFRFWKTCLSHVRGTQLPQHYLYGYFRPLHTSQARPQNIHAEEIPRLKLRSFWRSLRARAAENGTVLPTLEEAFEMFKQVPSEYTITDIDVSR